MLNSKLQQFKAPQLTIIGVDFMGEGGAWRSVWELQRQLTSQGVRVGLLNRNRRKTTRKVVGTALFADKILINGLDTLQYWDCILLALCRKDLSIYLHETEYILDAFQKHAPTKFKIISHILGRRRLLCVSEKAAQSYRKRFGTQKTEVIFETIEASTPPHLDTTKTNIVMVGSINKRKGATLFAEVARRAQANHPDWAFHWVGMGDDSLLQNAPVHIHGWQRDPNIILRQSKLLFLSSIDDPFPLVCIEALQNGIPCVCFEQTGTSEAIAQLSPQSVFSHYTPEAALQAIEDTLAQPPSPQDLQSFYQNKLAPSVFTDRISNLFNIGISGKT